jgi:hypothetical protein
VRRPHPAAVVSKTQTATAARLMPVVSASQAVNPQGGVGSYFLGGVE